MKPAMAGRFVPCDFCGRAPTARYVPVPGRPRAAGLCAGCLVELGRRGGLRRPHVKDARAVGRNDPCPCGSGVKFKHCCGKGGRDAPPDAPNR